MKAVILGRVSAMMVFATEPAQSARWWSDVTGAPVQVEDGFHWLDIDGVEFGFHPEDPAKNPVGASTVVYWMTPNLDSAIDAVVAAGGGLHRGPLVVEPGRGIAQVVDPFGAVVGLEQRP